MLVSEYVEALYRRRVRVIEGSRVRVGQVGSIEYTVDADGAKRVLFDDGEGYWISDDHLELLPEPNNNPLPLPG